VQDPTAAPATGPDIDTDDREARVDAAIAEYLRATRDPTSFDAAAWLARHPEVADDLAAFLRAEAAIGGLNTAPPATLSRDPETPTFEPGPAAVRVIGHPSRPEDDYELIREIGRGGMGVVYEARQRSLNRIVALKTVLTGELASGREIDQFRRESEAAAALDHPNIVPIYEVGELGGQPFFAMKLIGGGSLSARGASFAGKFREIAGLVGAVARAVHHAHQRGVLHRDLKPSNILLDESGAPYVGDFGLARRLEGAPTQSVSGTVAGTPAYMAPEQARGERGVSVAADVYGLGGVLYHLLTGSAPFRGDSTPETLLLVLLGDPTAPRVLRPDVPRDLETICLKCLEKEPTRRYPSAAELAAELDRWLRGEPILARPAGRLERAAKWARRNPGWATAAAVVVLSLVVLATGSVVAAALFKEERDTARANENRALDAEHETRRMLFDALRSVPGEVRGMRLRGERGAYFVGMPKLRDVLAKARELGAPPDVAHAVRNEMMNLLTAPDVTVDREWEWPAMAGATWIDYNTVSNRFAHDNADRSRVTVTPLDGGTSRTVPGAQIWFCPDGRKALSIAPNPNPDQRVTCWDLERSPARALWERTGVNCAAFTPDGRFVAVSGPPDGSHDTVLVDTETGHETRRFTSYVLCYCLPIHPSRPWLALQRFPQPIRVVDYRTGEDVAKVGDGFGVNVSWHPTRPVLASPDANFRIHLVNVTTDRDVIPPLEGHTTAGVVMRFDRTGDRLVSWDWSGVVRVWDLATGYQTFCTPVASIMGAWFEPGGDVLVARTAGRTTVQVLRIRLGEGLRVAADHPDETRTRFTGAAWSSPDGRLVVAHQQRWSTEEGLRFGDSASGAELARLTDRTVPVGFEQPSGSLVTHQFERGFERWPVQVLTGGRLRVGPPKCLIAAPGYGFHAGLSPDGRVLVLPGGDKGAWIFHPRDTDRPVQTALQSDVRNASVSPDGRWVVTASHSGDGGVRVHDVGTGKLAARLHDCSGNGEFSPDGTWVGIADYRGAGKLVRVGTWADHLALGGHPKFSPDSRLVAVGEGVGTVRLLECETGREVARLEVADPTGLRPVAFSPDGGRLYAVGSDTRALHLWTWDLRHLRARLKEMGADWDWLDFPPTAPAEPVTAVEVVTPKP
jgi:WD40 repeat protein